MLFFLMKFLKTKKKNIPTTGVELEAFGALPMELNGNIPSAEYLIYIKKESTLSGLWENFIEFLSKPTRTYYFLFRQVNNFLNQC